MATLESIELKIDALTTAVSALTPDDNTAVLAAVADLKTEVQTNVEGDAPVVAPAPEPAPAA